MLIEWKLKKTTSRTPYQQEQTTSAYESSVLAYDTIMKTEVPLYRITKYRNRWFVDVYEEHENYAGYIVHYCAKTLSDAKGWTQKEYDINTFVPTVTCFSFTPPR